MKATNILGAKGCCCCAEVSLEGLHKFESLKTEETKKDARHQG